MAVDSSLDWYYKDDRHFRQTIDNESPALDSTSMIAVADGRELWFYDASTNSYSRVLIPPGNGAPSLLGLSVWMGPVPTTDLHSFVALLKSYGKAGTVEVVGSDQILGRKVRIIETKSATGESVERKYDGTETRTVGPLQTTRLWFDTETQVVMRYLQEPVGDRQGIEMTVTKLELDFHIARGTFLFEPPPGAAQRVPSTTRVSNGTTSVMGAAGRTPPLNSSCSRIRRAIDESTSFSGDIYALPIVWAIRHRHPGLWAALTP